MKFSWLVWLTIAIVLSCSPAFAWHGLVVKVLDGDSIRVKRNGKIHEIRLYGIDAPEYGQGYGNKAKSYTRAHTYKKTVTIEPMDTDRYGRIVALVKSQGRLVNRELVRDGLAWVYPKYCNRPSLCNKMKELESKAKKQRRGLWKAKDPISPWEWKRRKKATGSPAGVHREYHFPYRR